ncbi:MAG TPA: HEPN domain-containing protein [Planctomycetaceae bacterium]|jgi:HEPN domain-containing protein|nr:HEPN domain-containing protein [Planctomycetaceae bacterium]
MASSSRDFQRAAAQRLTAAEFLLKNRYNLDAMYLAGYTIECSLKALILEATPEADRKKTLAKIRSGKKMHNPELLAGLLKDLNRPVPLAIAKRFRASGWSTDLRYESGRTDTGGTRAFLKTAKAVYDWVEGQLL